jgi:hypothetical protein
MTGRGLWPFVLAWAACSNSRLNPDDWYPVSVPVAAARREAAAAIAVCAACPGARRVPGVGASQLGDRALRRVGRHCPAEREKLRAGRVTQLAHLPPRNQAAGQVAS